MGQFRAAETGRPLLQAAISGISAVVDHTGRVRSHTKLFEPTVLVGEVDTYRGRTPYTVVGEWVPLGSAVLPRRLGWSPADSDGRGERS